MTQPRLNLDDFAMDWERDFLFDICNFIGFVVSSQLSEFLRVISNFIVLRRKLEIASARGGHLCCVSILWSLCACAWNGSAENCGRKIEAFVRFNKCALIHSMFTSIKCWILRKLIHGNFIDWWIIDTLSLSHSRFRSPLMDVCVVSLFPNVAWDDCETLWKVRIYFCWTGVGSCFVCLIVMVHFPGGSRASGDTKLFWGVWHGKLDEYLASTSSWSVITANRSEWRQSRVPDKCVLAFNDRNASFQ